MSIETLMQEIVGLGEQDQRKIAAFLVTLRDSSVPGYKEELARRADEADSSRWLTLEELDLRLGL